MKWKIFYKNNYALTVTEKYILDYFEANKKFCAQANISQIAKKGNFSISSMSKLVRKLGFDSFKAMQIYANVEIQKNLVNQKQNSDQLLNIAETIKLKYQLSIERTIRELDSAILKKLIYEIKNTKFIYSFGIGSSRLAALELVDNLMAIGYLAKFPNSIHELFKFINKQNKDESLIIIFSKLLRGKELEIMREIATTFNIKVFLITSNFGITKYNNENVIYIRTSEQEKRISALSSKISQQLMVDIITNYIGNKENNEIFKNFNKKWR